MIYLLGLMIQWVGRALVPALLVLVAGAVVVALRSCPRAGSTHQFIMMKAKSNPRALLIMNLRTLFFLVGCFCLSLRAASGEEEWKPVSCDSAKPYHGPKLHARPPANVFAGAGGSLVGLLDTNTIMRLEKAFERALAATKAPAMTVAVGVPGEGLWSATRTAHLTAGETASQVFYWASAGKAFTAVVVLRLVEEGKLKLDDKLARWFPDFPNAKVITLDHLLTHTSGLYSFQNDPALRAQPGYKSPETLLAVAKAHGNAFCPGEYWAYCNTGYVLLARIVEQIEGQPFHAVVTRRIIHRLGLKHTRSLAPNSPVADIAPAHPSKPKEVEAAFHFSTPFGAGNIVSTAEDLVRFWSALLGGQFVKPKTVQGMFERLYPMFGQPQFYGRGVMLYDVPKPDGCTEVWLGHSGGCPGIKAVVAYAPEAGAFVAVALNNDGSAEATAHLLFKALKEAQ